MSIPSSHYDIIIVGGGIVGATAALALAKNKTLKIALLDTKPLATLWQQSDVDYRVSAISLASQRIFQNLQVWPLLEAKRLSPYVKMHVFESCGTGAMHFDCAAVHANALGYIIEDQVLRSSLFEKIAEQPHIHLLSPVKLIALQENTQDILLKTADQQTLTAKLVIGADGAHSWVRQQAQIGLTTWDYEQTALVTTVKTTLPHQQTARQRFLPTGPLAFLPLREEKTCSIVWSTSPDEAEKLYQLPVDLFAQALTTAFAATLGETKIIAERYLFPLKMRHAQQYVKSRIVLLGDAAHTIHPMAGQGVNMGLLDAASLADIIQTAISKKRDFTALYTLRRYERWRKSENIIFLGFVELLKKLYVSQQSTIQSLRNKGMHFTNQFPLLKNGLTHYALGQAGHLPSLAM